jgi:hypothetical protein
MKLTTLLSAAALAITTFASADNCVMGYDYCGWDLMDTGNSFY